MRLTVHNFRCYQDYTLELEAGKISLLRGPSGCGKSTLLQALTWCLYGKVRLTLPWGSPNHAKSWVTLQVEDCTVYRQKNPGLLRYSSGDESAVDKVAQELIHQRFGLSWHISSYLCQQEHNPFLSLTNEEKMHIIRGMAFRDDDPAPYLEKIRRTLQGEEGAHRSLLSSLQQEIERFSSLLQGHAHLSLEDLLSPEELSLLQDEAALLERERIPSLKQEVAALLLRQEQRKKAEERLRSLRARAQLEEAATEERELVRQFPIVEQLGYPGLSLSALLQRLQQEQGELQRKGELEAELKSISALLVPLSSCDETCAITEESQRQTLLQEQLHLTNRNKALQWGLQYQEEAVQSRISHIETLLRQQPLLLRRQEREGLLRKIQKVQQTRDELLNRLASLGDLSTQPVSLEELRLELERWKILQREASVLTCPACCAALSYQGGRLVRETTPSVTEEEAKRGVASALLHVREEESRVGRLREGREIQEKLAHKEQRLAQLQRELLCYEDVAQVQLGTLLSPQEHQTLSRELGALKGLEIVAPPSPSAAEGDRILRKRALLLKKRRKEAALFPLLSCTPFPVSLLESLSSCIQRQGQREGRLQLLRQQCQEEEEALSRYGEVPAPPVIELEAAQERLSLLEERICRHRETEHLTQERRRVEELHHQTCQKALALSHWQELLRLAERVECETLQSTVDRVSSLLQTILPYLFDSPIQVLLSLFRSDKKGESKQKVSLVIRYQEGEIESLSQVSGGEGDRISLALTIAFNILQDSPFLFLDEGFSALDDDLRERAIEALRHFLPDKTIVCINHAGTEGFYDRAIDITH